MLLKKLNHNTITIAIFFSILISFIIGNFAINFFAIIASFWTIHSIYRNKFVLNKISLDVKILLFFFITIIASSFFKNLDLKDLFLLKFLGLSLFSYFLKEIFNKNIDLIYLFLLVVISFLSIDIIFQNFYGKNFIGFGKFQNIIPTGFFGSVKISGSYISKIIFILFTIFLCIKKSKKDFTVILFVLAISLFAILLSTERKSFFDTAIYFFLIPIIFPQKKTLIILGSMLIFFFIYLNVYPQISTTIFKKTLMQFGLMKKITSINEKELTCVNSFQKDCYLYFGINKKSSITNNQYYAHYATSIKIWKDNPIFGSGNKKFRKYCSDKKYEIKDNEYSSMRCSTHPHNIYLTILSEHGIVGFLIFVSMIARIILNQNNWKNNNPAKYFLPLFLTLLLPVPNGNIFSTWLGSFFWLTLGFLLKKRND